MVINYIYRVDLVTRFKTTVWFTIRELSLPWNNALRKKNSNCVKFVARSTHQLKMIVFLDEFCIHVFVYLLLPPPLPNTHTQPHTHSLDPHTTPQSLDNKASSIVVFFYKGGGIKLKYWQATKTNKKCRKKTDFRAISVLFRRGRGRGGKSTCTVYLKRISFHTPPPSSLKLGEFQNSVFFM